MDQGNSFRWRWIDYSGVYVTQEQWNAHQKRVAEESQRHAEAAAKLADARAEIERLWKIAHPDSPFPYEVYGYDW